MNYFHSNLNNFSIIAFVWLRIIKQKQKLQKKLTHSWQKKTAVRISFVHFDLHLFTAKL